jgi:hypothetical protein
MKSRKFYQRMDLMSELVGGCSRQRILRESRLGVAIEAG